VCGSSVLRLKRLDHRDCRSPCDLLHCLASKFSTCGSCHRPRRCPTTPSLGLDVALEEWCVGCERLCIWNGSCDSLQAPWLTPNNHASVLPQDRIADQVDRYQATLLWSSEAIAKFVLSSRDSNTLRIVLLMMLKRKGRGGCVCVCVALLRCVVCVALRCVVCVCANENKRGTD
jgi:hypothetical protein